MNKAYKFRAYPNKNQIELINKTFGCTRFIYNQMLGDRIKHYKETKEKLNNTPAQYKEEYPWLKDVDSLALCNAQLNLNAAYNNFFKNIKSGFPKFKSKKNNKQSYTTNVVKTNIILQDGYLKLPKLGFVKIKQHRAIPDNFALKSVTVSKSATNKYYVSILFEYENQVSQIIPEKFIGLDYSMSRLYIDSNGNEPHCPRYYRRTEHRLAKQQRKLSRMINNSHNYDKQKIIIARLHEKISNSRKDFLHKLSRELANTYDCVCIEDLNMQNMSQSLHFGKSVYDNGWGIFITFLKYKLEEQGKQLIKVDKYYASSQVCSVCGYKNVATKNLSIREWDCPECGTHHDRDVNAAINIRNEGMRLINA